jgi:prepilin-type N-terminal cleavage/methylation domain-containing protein/prepilin-type processing-associated H-X9-DG protein
MFKRRMPARGTARQASGVRRQAFTLIELLVVIAILALLVTMLMPALAKARSIAIRAVCMANFKTVGTLIGQFAATHNGRGPSDCYGIDASGAHRGRDWEGYINVEILGQRYYWPQTGGTIQAMGTAQVKGLLYCPSEKWYGSLYPRAWTLNINVAGGSSGADPNHPEMYSSYGINVPNPPSLPIPDDMIPSNTWKVYGLGPIMERFPRTNYEFMVTEMEAGWEYGSAAWPYADMKLGVWSSSTWTPVIPPWCDSGPSAAQFAFRHTLPPDLSLYQEQASANFLYIDGHVNCMNTNSTINTTERFFFNENQYYK